MPRRMVHYVLLMFLLAGGSGFATWALAASWPGRQAVDNSGASSINQQVKLFEVRIHEAPPAPRVDLGRAGPDGQPLTASCSTCHATRQPNHVVDSANDMDVFHQGLTFQHGTLACLSCHNEGDYDALRLANSASVAYADVMTLCSQCHGPQRRDYDNGAHGGMSGYWDLSRGPRVRNNCVDCHDPHFPAFPMMQPTFKPRDRFLDSHEHGTDQSHE